MNMKDNVSFAATLSTNWKKLSMSQDSTRLLGPDDLLWKNICLLLNRHYILSQTHYRRTFKNRKHYYRIYDVNSTNKMKCYGFSDGIIVHPYFGGDICLLNEAMKRYIWY